jgi:hypothetical protein
MKIFLRSSIFRPYYNRDGVVSGLVSGLENTGVLTCSGETARTPTSSMKFSRRLSAILRSVTALSNVHSDCVPSDLLTVGERGCDG